jgi:hypothetical protein
MQALFEEETAKGEKCSKKSRMNEAEAEWPKEDGESDA